MTTKKKMKIMVAMSGGVDSSVAAVLLKRKYPDADVVGVTMKLWNESDEKDRHKVGGCCSLSDTMDAARVCRTLGIRHYVFNYSDIFRRKIAEPFLRDYLGGLTPNPCVICNEEIKFGVLMTRARMLGFDYLATGHYARIVSVSDGNFLIKKARDEKKDQSYFLWRVPQEALKKVIFPVGEYLKSEVRGIADELKLPVAHKKESYDVCFAMGDYRGFISSNFAEGSRNLRGEIVDEKGRILGYHNGIYNFTVGQRSGLGVASSQGRLYVVKIDAATNRVIVGPRESALKEKFFLRNCALFSPYDEKFSKKKSYVFDVKIRYNTPPYKAVVHKVGKKIDDAGKPFFEVEFKGEPVFGVTPGQSAVFYDGEVIAGGGIIC